MFNIPSSQFSLLWCKENPIPINNEKSCYILLMSSFMLLQTQRVPCLDHKRRISEECGYSFDCNDEEYSFQASKGDQSPIKVVPMTCALFFCLQRPYDVGYSTQVIWTTFKILQKGHRSPRSCDMQSPNVSFWVPRKKTVIQVWNNSTNNTQVNSMSKWWQNFHFGRTIPLKLCFSFTLHA